MKKSLSKSVKTRVALAIAFAAGANANYESVCAAPPGSTGQQSLKNAKTQTTSVETDERKSQRSAYIAYRMLYQAEQYSLYEYCSKVQEDYSRGAWVNFNFQKHGMFQEWARRLTKTKPTTPKHADLAIATIKQALKELDSCSDQYAKQNLYFIASLLYRNAGDKSGYAECNAEVEHFIRKCELRKPANENSVAEAALLLNLRSYEILAVDIPYQSEGENFLLQRRLNTPVETFSAQDIANGEAIWRRSIALADKLDPSSHTRRLVHRNLCLWYRAVGLNAKSEHQKQILFGLIEKKDDKFLNPSPGICGALVWWEATSDGAYAVDCGMG